VKVSARCEWDEIRLRAIISPLGVTICREIRGAKWQRDLSRLFPSLSFFFFIFPRFPDRQRERERDVIVGKAEVNHARFADVANYGVRVAIFK